MPFKPPFENNFYLGDLLYGLGPMIKHYITNNDSFMILATNPFPVCTINDYVANEIERNYYTSNSLRIPKYQESFYHSLESHSKYKSVTVNEPYLVLMAKEQHVVMDSQGIARKCKAGLNWAANSYDTERKFTVHFILDDINISDVVNKASSRDHIHLNAKSYLRCYLDNPRQFTIENHQSNLNKPIKCKSITGAELRWLYRNKDNLAVQKSIQFWYDGKPCCPPWCLEFDGLSGKKVSRLWQAYLPKNHK